MLLKEMGCHHMKHANYPGLLHFQLLQEIQFFERYHTQNSMIYRNFEWHTDRKMFLRNPFSALSSIRIFHYNAFQTFQ